MNYENLMLDLRDSVGWITINRPDQFNALNIPTARELLAAVTSSMNDPNVRAIVLTGAGEKAFCAGGDVGDFEKHIDDIEATISNITTPLHQAVSRLTWGRVPVIAAVNGVAAGGGLSMVAAADLVIAVDTARFTSAYTQIGLTPDGSTSYFLPRLIGHRRTIELYFTNRVLSAQEALEWGLVNRVVAPADFKAEVSKLAMQLASGPTLAYASTKKLVQIGINDTLESQMERESRTVVEMARTGDGREGIRAFAEKRKPIFKGQ